MQENPLFSLQEYRRRLTKVQERMDHAGIEVLLVVDPANMNYLTGYDGWSFYVHQGVIVSLEEEVPLWFGRQQDSNGARQTCWLPDDCIFGYADHYVQSRYTHTMSYVAGLLRERGMAGRNLGLEMDGYWFSARMYLTLQEEMPQTTFVDATGLVNWVKTIKSPREIEYMHQAAEICEKVMHAAIKVIEPGVWEKHAAARVCGEQIEGTASFGGSSPAIFPIMPSAQRTAAAHLTYEPDRQYEKGDVVMLELAGARHRYNMPLSRTLYLGEPPEDLQKTAEAVVEGVQRTLEFIRPGISAEAVEECWRRAIEHTGVVKPSRVGYSFGLNYVPDWGEHTISLRPGDKTILQPGMTLHFMPGIWLDTYGFECSEPVLITESGCEPFVSFERKLFVKE